jgi:selenoprotein W-related protein
VILAGFALTAAVTLHLDSHKGPIKEAAIASFGLSAVVLVLALAFIATAEDYAVNPDDRLKFHPEARVSAEALDEERKWQRQDEFLVSLYSIRVGLCVLAGIATSLAGLSLVLFIGHWTVGSIIVAAAAGLVVVIHVYDHKRAGNWWLFPRPVLPVEDETTVRADFEQRFGKMDGLSQRRQSRRRKRLERELRLRAPTSKGPLDEVGVIAMVGRPHDQNAAPRETVHETKARVEIEYCTQCQWLPRVAWLAQELLTTFEAEISEVVLVPGSGGVFILRVDSTVLWDQREHGFPEPTAVKRLVRDRVAPGKDLRHTER